MSARGDKRLAVFLGFILVATGLLSLLTLRGWAWGVKDEWQWHRGDEFLGGTILLPFIPLVVALVLLPILLRWHQAARPGRLDTVLTVVSLVVITLALQMAVWFVPPGALGDLGQVVLSPETTTYFLEAHRVDSLPRLLADYVRVMPRLAGHARTHPPGPVVLFWAIQNLVERWPGLERAVVRFVNTADPAGFALLWTTSRALARLPLLPAATVAAAVLSGFLLSLLGSLSVLFVYFLARLLHGPQAAVAAGFCAAVIPSLILFAPTVDQVVALLAAAGLLALCAAGLRGSALLAAVAGVLFALGAFVSLSALALIPMGGLWLALSPSRRRLAVSLAWAGAFVAVFVLLFVLFRFNFAAVVVQGMIAHRAEAVQARTYHRWLFENLVDVVFFLGLPLALWLGRDLLRQAWAARRAAMHPFLLAWLITVLALDLSGLVRGEAGRLWMFLLVPAAVPVGAAIARTGRGVWLATTATLVMQVVQVVVFKEMLTLFVVWA